MDTGFETRRPLLKKIQSLEIHCGIFSAFSGIPENRILVRIMLG